MYTLYELRQMKYQRNKTKIKEEKKLLSAVPFKLLAVLQQVNIQRLLKPMKNPSKGFMLVGIIYMSTQKFKKHKTEFILFDS